MPKMLFVEIILAKSKYFQPNTEIWLKATPKLFGHVSFASDSR